MPVDMDWDDEDEKTTIFERGNEDAARALLRSAPPPRMPTPLPPAYGMSPTMPPSRLAAARVPHFPGGPPHNMPRGVQTQPSFQAPQAAARPSASPFAATRSTGGKSVLFAIATLLVVGLAAAGVILFMPKSGNLVVTVSGPGNKPIDSFQVLLNGKDRCHTSPCRITGLEQGTHLIRVVAPGYQQTADQAVKIQPGDDAVSNIVLAPVSEGTGLKVVADGNGLTLSIDGKDIGNLPAEVKDLSPGEHTVKIVDKNERYETFEKKVTVEADKIAKIEPKLKVKKGLAMIRAGENAQDARVLLVSGDERRPVPNLPIRIDITMDKSWSLLATKKGFADFKQDITFEDNQAEKTFIIALTPSGEATDEKGDKADTSEKADKTDKADKLDKTSAKEERAEEPAPRRTTRSSPAPRPRSTPRRNNNADSEDTEDSEPASTAGIANGILNITSSPPATVVLDGKPLGSTPRTGVSVAPGPHTLLFVHPDYGRKSRTVTVQAGKAASASVNFP